MRNFTDTGDLKIYTVLKNEDANPFVGNNLLVVADGLGGSGSTVHSIDKSHGNKIKEMLMQSAFADFNDILLCSKNKWFKDYLDDLMEPMIDDEDDTSALWASRIVIARTVFALNFVERFKNGNFEETKIREELSEFISIGLKRTVKKFGFTTERYSEQILLPSTLALIKVNKIIAKEKKLVVDVMWSGDSRCYYLNKDGLKQLSIDDEELSGEINNLFYAGDKNATINFKRYTLDMPCILFACSDGIFDPFGKYDFLAVEKVLLENINASKTFVKVKQGLSDYYSSIHGDDTTIAFKSFGFSRFEELQRYFKKRNEEVDEMWKNLISNKEYLDIMSSNENCRDYVVSRTNDKYNSICKMISEKTDFDKCDDVVLRKVFAKLFVNKYKLVEFLKEKMQSNAKNITSEVVDSIVNTLNPEKNLSVRYKDTILNYCNLFKKLSGYQEREEVIFKELEKYEKSLYSDLETKSNEIADILNGKTKDKGNSGLKQLEKECVTIEKNIVRYTDLITRLKIQESCPWKKIKIQTNIEVLSPFIDDYIKLQKEINSNSYFRFKPMTLNFKRVKLGIRSNLNKLLNMFNEPENYVVLSSLLSKPVFEELKTILSKSVDSVDILKNHKEEVINVIANAIGQSFNKESAFDQFYNARKLKTYKMYCILSTDKETKKNILELNKNLNEFYNSVNKYIK